MNNGFREAEPESFESSFASSDRRDDYPAHQPVSSLSRRSHRSGIADDLDVDSDDDGDTLNDGFAQPASPVQFASHEASTQQDSVNQARVPSPPPSPPVVHAPPTPQPTTPSSAVTSPLGDASPLSMSHTNFNSQAPMQFKRMGLLGKGANGSVYKAVTAAGQFVAIKQLSIAADTSSHALRDIEREIAINSALPPHPHCVQYLGIRSTAKNIYIIMELVSGGSVQSLLRSVGRFPEGVMRRYAHMTLLGLRHLHHHNIIHQDIKGANVIVDEKGTAKIADFGCSRDLSTTSSSSMAGGGTPLWMAPEVCRGEYASKQSDVWSFGCFLLEMTTEEQAPWLFAKGTTAFAVLYAIGAATRPPKPPAHLSPVAQDFISACLQIDRTRRATVDELLHHPFLVNDDSADCEDWGSAEEDEDPRDDVIGGTSWTQQSWKYGVNKAAASSSEAPGFILQAVENSPPRGGDIPPMRPTSQHRQAPSAFSSSNQGNKDSGWESPAEKDPYSNGTVWQSGGSEHVSPGGELYNIEELDDTHNRKRKKATSFKSEAEGTARKLAQRFSCLMSPK